MREAFAQVIPAKQLQNSLAKARFLGRLLPACGQLNADIGQVKMDTNFALREINIVCRRGPVEAGYNKVVIVSSNELSVERDFACFNQPDAIVGRLLGELPRMPVLSGPDARV